MKQGHFVWYELATVDTEAAGRFYGDVIGWSAAPVPGMPYTLFSAGERPVSGLMALPPHLKEAGVPSHWNAYIAVDDIDAMLGRLDRAGGSRKHGPEDIPGVGRFAVVADPGGAVFALLQGQGEAPPDAPMMTPGHAGWHELRAGDQRQALDFYTALFGWTLGRAIDMGPMGTYQLFGYDGFDRGGVMPAPGARPGWLFYFVVNGIDAAQQRVAAAGGTVLHGPQEVPGGAWTLMCSDPQQAPFALVSASR